MEPIAAHRGAGRRSGPPSLVRLVLVVGLLYVFLVGVGLLEDGIKTLSPDVQAELFASVSNPIAGLCVGVLATVLAQSSSVTTATIVGLVGSGLLSVEDATPMIMGANLGTTVTNTLVSLANVRRPIEFRHAFAAATVHDAFNLLSIIVLFPLELTTRVLSRIATAVSSDVFGLRGATYESPLRRVVKEPVGWVESVWQGVGLRGSFLGVVLLVTGLVCVFVGLMFITRNMRVIVANRVERSINEMLAKGAGIPAIVLGIVITVSVQSSTITTSILIPLAASGMLSLQNTYPITLGANVGTTVTALLASLASARPEALTIALVHTSFNIAGILLFYPVPAMRRLPIRIAEWLADMAVGKRTALVVYVLATFVFVPAIGVMLLR